MAGTFTLVVFYHRDENPVEKQHFVSSKKRLRQRIPNTLQDVCGNLGNPTRFHHPLLSFCLLIYKMMLINTSAIDEQCEFTCCQRVAINLVQFSSNAFLSTTWIKLSFVFTECFLQFTLSRLGPILLSAGAPGRSHTLCRPQPHPRVTTPWCH